MPLEIRLMEEKEGKPGEQRGAHVLDGGKIVASIVLFDEMKTVGVTAEHFKGVRIVEATTPAVSVVVQLDIEGAPSLPPGGELALAGAPAQEESWR